MKHISQFAAVRSGWYSVKSRRKIPILYEFISDYTPAGHITRFTLIVICAATSNQPANYPKTPTGDALSAFRFAVFSVFLPPKSCGCDKPMVERKHTPSEVVVVDFRQIVPHLCSQCNSSTSIIQLRGIWLFPNWGRHRPDMDRTTVVHEGGHKLARVSWRARQWERRSFLGLSIARTVCMWKCRICVVKP